MQSILPVVHEPLCHDYTACIHIKLAEGNLSNTQATIQSNQYFDANLPTGLCKGKVIIVWHFYDMLHLHRQTRKSEEI